VKLLVLSSFNISNNIFGIFEIMAKSEFNDAVKWLIYIAGSAKLQSELLAVFIEKETGLPCRIESDKLMFPLELVQERHSIIFSDCRDRTAKSIVSGMREFNRSRKTNAFVIMFNVDSSLNIEEELLGLGIWGIFHEEDPPSSLPLGVKAICKGEIWLSRQLMSSCLENFRRRSSGNDQSEKINSLTKRECEVLKMLSVGSGNDQIATDLCVSIHTVRSHLYRIFKKIDVANRHQASIWANRNL